MNSSLAIEATNLSKKYRLGTIGMSSLREDLSRWWRRKHACELDVKKESTAGIELSRMTNDSEFWALHDLNFRIPKGEVVGLIGANGSGKSTLLKILSRITEPSSGQVKVRGKVASLLEVGTGFHPELTGRENIYINGAILGMTRREVTDKFDEIVEFAGVSDFIDTPIKRYSSGMTVRLGFAVAAHLDPDILIVDEVLAVGDAEFQKKCLGKMEDISNNGKTIIFVSHQMPMVEKLCNDTLLLKDGIIQNFGKTKDIVNSYLESSNPVCNEGHSVTWSDRKGSGDITLSKIKINSSDLGESSNVKLGDKICFFFHFICKNKNLDSKQISFRFAIDNEQQMRVTTLDSRSINFFIKPSNAFIIKVNISKVSFPVGRYYITSFIGNEENPYDWITNAISFNVIQGDFYKTGRIQDMSPGEILIDHEMNLLHV